MAISLLQNGISGLASLPSLAAPDASSNSVCTVFSPATDSGLDRLPFHSSPSWTARSPPASQMKVTPLRQSWPGSQKPEKFAGCGLSFLSAMAALTNSSIVVGTSRLAFSNRSLR